MDEKTPLETDSPAGDVIPVEPVKDETIINETPIKDASTTNPAAQSGGLQGLTDNALHFLSHASNETLGACLVGLGATTYFVLGRVGLVIIGVAGGVVLQATWEGLRSDNRDEPTKKAELERRREAGVEVARRVLDWKAGRDVDEETTENIKYLSSQPLDFSSFEPETEEALNTFANAIVTDYVKYWYSPTLPGEETFPATCRRTLVAFLLSLTGHLRRKRPADAFLDFVTNASSIIIVFLNELAAALNASPNAPADEAIAAYLKLKPDSSLSYILDERSQNARLSDAAEDILQAYLDPKAYNCPPVHTFLKEVLAKLILGYTITLCSEPSWINDWIVYGLEESETAKEVMEIVDAGVEGRVTETPIKPAEPESEVKIAKTRDEETPNAEPATAQKEEKRRHVSRAEEAMDEAMREAKRLTQMMIEEDEKRTKEEVEKPSAATSSDNVSDATTHGIPTPTSSQSDNGRQEDSPSLNERSSVSVESPASTDATSDKQFTSFDQLRSEPPALNDSTSLPPPKEPAVLTLHKATIAIFDDSAPGERASIKAKPTTDFLVQIEPPTGAFSGWMIARKYADFEMLHEVLRRISVITGVPQFANAHPELPNWKTNTKADLRNELERYLTDAVQYQSLAESEGMKRFLEKDQGLAKSPGSKGFGWPTPDAFGKFGGDMMNVLTKAPKQVAGGGKVMFGGVAGVVGGLAGGKKNSQSQSNAGQASVEHSPASSISKPRPSMADRALSSLTTASPRSSMDSLRGVQRPVVERKQSMSNSISSDNEPRQSTSSQRPSSNMTRSVESASALAESTPAPSVTSRDDTFDAPMNLPPPPSEISDDFGSPIRSDRKSTHTNSPSIAEKTTASSINDGELPPETPPRPGKPEASKKEQPPITERETSVAIELMFAVITELYTLSSAWNIRRTFLTAAKTFLLRPGNPQLTTIQQMLQSSLLDSNLSDKGVAGHIYKLRENALPTEKEMEIWTRDYPPKTDDQKEELRIKARKLLVSRGMPQALTSVMGAAASGEALGKVFDCLQQPNVSRGLIFGLMLQALKIVTN